MDKFVFNYTFPTYVPSKVKLGLSGKSEVTMTDQTLLKKYAHALLVNGLNLQKNQILVINVDVDSKDFAVIVTEEAYALGAKDVVLNWRHTPITRQRLLHASQEVLEHPAKWIPVYYQEWVDQKAAFLSLISANPKALANIPTDRISLQSRAMNKALEFYHKEIMSSGLTWCVASVATPLWAKLLGYTGSEEEQVDALWNEIFTLCRIANVEEDQTLTSHLDRLKERTKALNELGLTALHYTCPNGTDLTIRLPQDHLWQGGAESSKDGLIFNANIPTEEVFTAPQWNGVNGIVHSTKPLIYQGNPIEDFSITFQDGKIIDYTAQIGQDILKELIESDQGSSYLGELALVDHYSPISQSNKIFFETLFDENASCHLAIGAAYPTCLKNSDDLTQEELKERGLNHSLTHVDFMIGHEKMTITGQCVNGQEVPIMVNGRLQV